MFNVFERVNWQAAYDVLLRGNPPLIAQLLLLNSIIFIIFVYKRTRNKGPRGVSFGHMAQAAFIAANVLVMTQQQLHPFYEARVMGMWKSVDRMITR